MHIDTVSPAGQVTALRQIDAGEQIAATYVDLWLPTGERRAALQRRMGFSCGCRTPAGGRARGCGEKDPSESPAGEQRRERNLVSVNDFAPCAQYGPQLISPCGLRLF